MCELEHHDQARRPRSVHIVASITEANRREGTLDGFGGRQVSPALYGDVVGGESGVPVRRVDHACLVVLGPGVGQQLVERLPGRLTDRRLGSGSPGRTDAGSVVWAVDAPLPYHRVGWREYSVPRVENNESDQEAGMRR